MKLDRMLDALEYSDDARACRATPACAGKRFVHDLKKPNDVERKANARIVIVGESPGYEEDQMGRPFVGHSGTKIRSALQSARLAPDDVYATNVVKCRPTKLDGSARKTVNRSPAASEIAACKPLLEAELGIMDPSVIVAFGGIAIKALTGVDSVSRAIDQGLLYYKGIPVIPTYHPASTSHLVTTDPNEALRRRELRHRALARAAAMSKKPRTGNALF